MNEKVKERKEEEEEEDEEEEERNVDTALNGMHVYVSAVFTAKRSIYRVFWRRYSSIFFLYRLSWLTKDAMHSSTNIDSELYLCA